MRTVIFRIRRNEVTSSVYSQLDKLVPDKDTRFPCGLEVVRSSVVDVMRGERGKKYYLSIPDLEFSIQLVPDRAVRLLSRGVLSATIHRYQGWWWLHILVSRDQYGINHFIYGPVRPFRLKMGYWKLVQRLREAKKVVIRGKTFKRKVARLSRQLKECRKQSISLFLKKFDFVSDSVNADEILSANPLIQKYKLDGEFRKQFKAREAYFATGYHFDA